MIRLLAILALAGPYDVPPMLEPLKPCYVTVQTSADSYETESLYLAGSGFTPGALVDVSIDGEIVAEGLQAREDGKLPGGTLPSPAVFKGERRFTLSAGERDNPSRTASTAARVSVLSVAVKPKRARPSRRVRFRGRGFTEARPVYAHYLRKNKLRRTVKLERVTTGVCGHFSVRRPQFPFRPSQGTWRVQIDQHRRLSDEGPLFNLLIDVRRRPRSG